jgi:hypothetical protein
MESKKVTKRLKAMNRKKAIRITLDTFTIADKFVDLANEKKIGGKIKIDQVLDLAVRLLNDSHVSQLQSSSLKNSDRQELMRQKYIKLYGQISKEDYIGFTMSDAYPEFLKNTSNVIELEKVV